MITENDIVEILNQRESNIDGGDTLAVHCVEYGNVARAIIKKINAYASQSLPQQPSRVGIQARIEENESVLEMAILHSDNRTVIVLKERIIQLKNQLSALPQQPESAGLRWRDAKKEHPTSADSYHVKVFNKEGDGYTFPAVLCYTMGMWEVTEENHEVIFWLDENN